LNKGLCFFQDDAQKKWPLRGSKGADNLMSQIIGVRFQVGELLNPETGTLKPSFLDNMLSDKTRYGPLSLFKPADTH